MSNHVKKLAAALACAASLGLITSAASASPVMNALALKNAAPNAAETVRWGGGWHGGWHRGWGWGGFAAGAIIGSAIAAPYYYGYGPYYYPYYPAPYPPPYPAYAPGPGGDAVAYCAQRFRSYDPRTGTYLGLDGVRHPCP